MPGPRPPCDHDGLAVLTFEECLRLAASEPVGRLAFAEAGEIRVLPVNHQVVDGLIAFRTGDGAKLGAAIQNSVVAFEVDRYDRLDRTGWSVLIKGRAHEVTDPRLLLRLDATGLQPWNSRVPRPNWVVVRPDEVTGRAL